MRPLTRGIGRGELANISCPVLKGRGEEWGEALIVAFACFHALNPPTVANFTLTT